MNILLVYIDSKPINVIANDGKTGATRDLSYVPIKPIGHGSFGVVYQARIIDTGQVVAIKRVLQDKRYKVSLFSFFLIIKSLKKRLKKDPKIILKNTKEYSIRKSFKKEPFLIQNTNIKFFIFFFFFHSSEQRT